MVVVAVAGGTGGIGSAIVDRLRQNPQHKMIILTRKVRSISSDNNKQEQISNGCQDSGYVSTLGYLCLCRLQ